MVSRVYAREQPAPVATKPGRPPAVAQPSDSGLLFLDTFDSEISDAWTKVGDGSWSIKDGALVLKVGGWWGEPPVLRVLQRQVELTDGFVSVKAKLGRDARFGLIFRYRDVENYCVAFYAGGDVQLVRKENGRETRIATDRIPSIPANEWHELKANFEGADLSFYVDNSRVLYTKDATLAKGRVGLQVGYATDISFDDFSVRKAGGQ